MKLVVDIIFFIFMFLFAYAFGRKSESDGKPVVPVTVTWFTLFIILGITFILNLPGFIRLVQMYR